MKKAIITLSILCSVLLIINPLSDKTFAQGNDNSIIRKENTTIESGANVIKVLSEEQAKEVLGIYNSNLSFNYEGDEDTFISIKDKNLEGYVFTADVESDLGYFVDKNTSNIYYFHPSGYLEMIIK